MSRKIPVDAKDIQILNILQKDGSISNLELAEKIGLSPSPTLNRVEELIKRGYIESFTAAIKFDKFGYKFQAIVEYTIPEDFTDDFIAIISISPFMVFFTQLNRHMEIGTRHSKFMLLYTHKSREAFLQWMKTMLEPIPYNVDYRIYEVTRIIKKLPTIDLSLEDVVKK